MPNYPEQYFNQDTTEPQGFSNQNKAIVKEEIVSGENQNKIYVAQLVKLAGPGINVSVGSIAVDLDHTTDSIKIGDGSDLWLINPDGSGKISGSTVIYSSGGTSVNVYADGSLYISGSTRIADGSRVVSINSDNSLKISGGTVLYDSGSTRSVNVLSNNALKISGTTQIGDGTRSVDVLSNNALKISGSTQISDGTNVVSIFSDGSLRISGSTVIYGSGSTPANVNVLSNNALKISGTTQIGDGTNTVTVFSNNALKISGSTQISDGTRSVDILSNNALRISGSTQISDGTNTLRINPDGTASISGNTVIYNSGGTTSVNVLSNNALKISGSTQISDGTRSVDVLSNNALKISGTTQIGDGTNSVDIVKGALRVSGSTIIGDETGVVNMISGHLKISGITSIQNVNVSGNSLQVLIVDNEGYIGRTSGNPIKPQIKITRLADTTSYSGGDVINSGGTLMENFVVSRSNNKNTIIYGAHMTSSVSAATSLNADLIFFSSGFTITADNTQFEPNNNELEFYLGTASFSSWKSMGNKSKSDAALETPFILKPESGTQKTYTVLQARNGYIPSSGEIFTINLDIEQN